MSEQSGPVPQRIGDAERDEAVEALREHMAQGRLDQSEFDERLTTALSARTRADLDPLFTDLPDPKPGSKPAALAAVPTPAAELTQRPQASLPQRGLGAAGAALAAVAAMAWPLTILGLLFIPGGWSHIWWIWMIPVFLTMGFGRYRQERRR